MEIVSEDRIEEYVSNKKPNLFENSQDLKLRYNELLIELEELRLRSAAMEDNLIDVKQQRDDALKQNFDLVKTVKDISIERDILQGKLQELEIFAKQREKELIKERDDELNRKLEVMEGSSKRIRVFSKSMNSVKECVLKVIEEIDEERSEKNVEIADSNVEELDLLDEESKGFVMEIKSVYKLVMKVGLRLTKYKEKRKKEKKELENSVVSLTEENRDINSLLRIALVEKEEVERSLSRLKGSGEQKKVTILQFAERGLQKVGFGFIMGASSGDTVDDEISTTGEKSESSECEEEVVSLVSTVETIMKNLRLEIVQLKQSLEEYRSDNWQLQSLTEKQAKKIAECTTYISNLEERENRVAKNVEQLVSEITRLQEEVERWREACELEVEAGIHVIKEHEREARIFREELGKAKASLDTLTNKLKLKEQLASAAVAAQEAAQKSLHVADRRAAELNERIEELTRQLEVADSRGERNIRRKVRHICWPWRAFKVIPGGPLGRNAKRMVPEMQGLLHYRI
ncbi:Atp-binding protein [Thalictrum thalictroides]|uniref:Atp-binding protein n=1 Tax=Thalictrum thalictroides TaxID=46969 RepID=A0A7J6UYY3_THATH|nr:Atp-binding protein [Thalictrum thalictroides]